MKKILVIILSILFLLGITSCGEKPNTEKELDPTEVVVSGGYTRYDLGEKTTYPLVGFGAQMDTDIFMPWNNMTAEDEAIWDQRIKDMNLKFTRIKYFPEFYERANDNNDPNVFEYNSKDVDFDCAEMQALYKVLDLCEKYDIMVDLSLSGCYNWFKSYDGEYDGSWLADSSDATKNYWVTGPTDYEEYAENIAVVLKYLIEEKKYTCIWGISNISESFFNEKGVKDWNEYVRSCEVIDARLKRDGLRDKVKFIGCSENGGIPKNYDQEFDTVDHIFDVCSTGNYNWDYTCVNDAIGNYFEEMIAVMKKYGKTNFEIAEFCQGKHFVDAVNKTDIDDYSAGLYIARFCIEAAAQGVTAFDHYILGDCYFTNAYVHTMGLWMYRDSNVSNPKYISWAAHPEYYFYSMVCKYTDRGSYAYKMVQQLKSEYDDEDGDITMTVFELPNGKWTYLIANSGTQNKKVAIVNTKEGHPTKMNYYKITEAWIPENRDCVLPEASSEIDATAGVAYITVPANGFVVVSDK